MTTSPLSPAVPVVADSELPAGLLDAFWAYDAALLANDTAAMDELFVESEHTVRGDQNGVLVGHDEIAAFRRARNDRPTRRVRRLWTQTPAPGWVLTLAEVAGATGATGLQTQLWRRDESGWRVYAAHVIPPAAAIDPAVWRVVGAPLVTSTGTGALDGHGIAVKDLFAVRGIARGGGVRAYLDGQEPQPAHAGAVAALLRAGASVTGITHTDQFAFGIGGRNADFGTPANLAAPARIPGGSSSGSAVAVKRGWASAGLGTDTAGSIRIPASYQGLWGFRPTHGVVDTTGVLPLAPSFDAVGWLARDGETLARVGEVLLPQDVTPIRRSLVHSDDVLALAPDPVRATVERASARLDIAGKIGPLPDLARWTAAFRVVQAYEAWQQHGAWLESHPGAVADDVRLRFEAGRDVTAGRLDDAWAVLREARAVLDAALEGNQLVLPAASSAAPPLDASAGTIESVRQRTIALNSLASLAGLPAVTIPALSDDGAPLGLCLVGERGSDLSLLRIARDVATQLEAG
ncbi:AtzH-like domain-containing protein [Nocardia miyunensis]|uniref:AtzH-like domain-containing protein n=1 Tax=Nocardia miyunensis TaxID=282684 RepID=UPI00082F0424|nr:AtzH-like domain-containing protein [Nocardia miyunensis]